MRHNILKECKKEAKDMDVKDLDKIVKIHAMKLREDELEQKYEEMRLKQKQLEEDRKFKWDWNMIANGAISLTTILLVLNYEKENIITSKSWNIANKWIGRG